MCSAFELRYPGGRSEGGPATEVGVVLELAEMAMMRSRWGSRWTYQIVALENFLSMPAEVGGVERVPSARR
jgi:hypothetical protein